MVCFVSDFWSALCVRVWLMIKLIYLQKSIKNHYFLLIKFLLYLQLHWINLSRSAINFKKQKFDNCKNAFCKPLLFFPWRFSCKSTLNHFAKPCSNQFGERGRMDRVGVGVGVGGVKRSVRKRSLCKRRIANMRLDGGRVESAKKAPDVAEMGSCAHRSVRRRSRPQVWHGSIWWIIAACTRNTSACISLLRREGKPVLAQCWSITSFGC